MPGSENYFVIDRIYHKKLEHPYNDCYINVSDSLFNKTKFSLNRFESWKPLKEKTI